MLKSSGSCFMSVIAPMEPKEKLIVIENKSGTGYVKQYGRWYQQFATSFNMGIIGQKESRVAKKQLGVRCSSRWRKSEWDGWMLARWLKAESMGDW